MSPVDFLRGLTHLLQEYETIPDANFKGSTKMVRPAPFLRGYRSRELISFAVAVGSIEGYLQADESASKVFFRSRRDRLRSHVYRPR